MKVITILVAFFSLTAAGNSHSATKGELESQEPIEQVSTAESNEPKNNEASEENLFDRVDFIAGKFGVDKGLVNFTKKTIEEIIKSSRKNQDNVLNYSKAINVNMNSVLEMRPEKKEIVDRVRVINSNLIEASYSNTLIQNSNLSNQIRTRLAGLIADSFELGSVNEKFSSKAYDNLLENFVFEHELISKKYLNARPFRLGVGAASLFLPKITYYGVDRVDFSQFESSLGSSSSTLNIVTQYTSEKTNSLFLAADFPYGQIDAVFQGGEASHTRVLPVRFVDLAGVENGLFHRDTINSTMNVEYDLNLNVSVRQIYQRTSGCSESRFCPEQTGYSRNLTRGSKRQDDFGIGLGITALDVEDIVLRDFRLETDSEKVFNNLESEGVVEKKYSNSYYLFHYGAYYTINVSDEFSATVSFRRYRNKSELDIGNISVQLKATWYPSFIN